MWNTLKEGTPRFLNWLWNHIDPVLALIVALVVGLLGAFGIVDIGIVAAGILGVLTVLAFTLIRERDGREKIREKVETVSTKLEEPPADSFFKRNATEIRDQIGIMNKRLDNPPADSFFQRNSPEASIIQDAEGQVWLAQETGGLVLERNKEALASLLKRGGQVRVISALPIGVTPRLLVFRNANLPPDGIVTRSKSFHDQLGDLAEKAGHRTQQLEVRYSPYPTDITSVIADPTHTTNSKRRALVRYAGFRVPYIEKLDFTIDGVASPGITQHYIRDFEHAFKCAFKVVLLTGETRVGKTTTWREVIDSFPQHRGLFFYILTESIWDKDVRTGFQIVTSSNPNPTLFAERRSDRDGSTAYDVKADVLKPVLSELEAARKQGKILVVDEIGPLQLQVPGFVDAVHDILNDKAVSLFATITLDDTDKKLALLREAKAHPRSSVHVLTKDNALGVQSTLREEIEASLRLAQLLPRNILEVSPV